jgi:5,10-methylenetetrahydrofolate reductase
MGTNYIIGMDEKRISALIESSSSAPWISIEFFPPKSESGIESLFHVLEKLKQFNPLFVDFTWVRHIFLYLL